MIIIITLLWCTGIVVTTVIRRPKKMGVFNKEFVHFMADSTLYGLYGFFSDSIDRLVDYVTTDYHTYFGRMSRKVSNNCAFPFVNEENGTNYRFFYHDPGWVNVRIVNNKELSQWLAQGNGEYARVDGTGHVCNCHTEWSYAPQDEHAPVTNVVVRKWGDDLWNEPTADYLGLGE